MNLKKINLTLIFLTITTLSFSQNTKLSVGLIGSPNFYSIKSHEGFNHQYQTNFSYSFGIAGSYNLNDKITIGMGLLYSKIKYNVDYDFMPFDPQDPSVPIKSNFNPTYLDIPVLFNYNFVTAEKINFFMSAGIISEILIKSNDNTTFKDNTIRDSGVLYSFLLGASIGLGIEYNLNENVRIGIEPNYRYYLKKIDVIMNKGPTSLGVSLSIFYHI